MNTRLYVDTSNKFYELVFLIGLEHTLRSKRQSGTLETKYYSVDEAIEHLKTLYNATVINCNLIGN